MISIKNILCEILETLLTFASCLLSNKKKLVMEMENKKKKRFECLKIGNNNVGVEWNIVIGIQQSRLIYEKNSYRLQLLAQSDFSWFKGKDGTQIICKHGSYSIVLPGVEWFLSKYLDRIQSLQMEYDLLDGAAWFNQFYWLVVRILKSTNDFSWE